MYTRIIQDESGNTALHYAAAAGKKDIVKYLLEQGADTTVVNAREQKAIDYASIKEFNEIASLLLSHHSPAPQPAASSASGITDMKKALLDLKELLDVGILSEAEFNEQKAKILAGNA